MVVKEFNMIEDVYERDSIDTLQIFTETSGATLLLASVAVVLALSALGTFVVVWWKLRSAGNDKLVQG